MHPTSTITSATNRALLRFPVLGPTLLFGLLSVATHASLDADQGVETKFPPELVKFVPYDKNPIFTAGPKGAWDEKIRERGWIMKNGEQWKMYYSGYRATGDQTIKLGFATSKDGVAWQRYPKNPIYSKHWTEDMMVVPHGGKFYMFAEGYLDRAHMLTSENGQEWMEMGKLDIRLKNGDKIKEGPYGTPTAWFENDSWHLFYEREDLGIWYATSKDTKVWTNVQDDPVMKPGPGEYDKDYIAVNQVLKYKGRYYAYYHGSAKSGPNAKLWCTCVATSKDLLNWEKYPGNPLQPIAQNKSSGIVIHDGQKFRLYTMHPEVNLHFAAP
jgi:predicted GH43/DUF377 family glycosyl hydrolase